jgi:crotonobetainyl-CoA:carnitine CoA-transferase CaiB-like acyl-CoA transferase
LLSGTPGGLLRPAPLLGQHTHEVLRQVLGYDESEIERLRNAGTLS